MKIGHLVFWWLWPRRVGYWLVDTEAVRRVAIMAGVLGLAYVNYLATKYITLPLFWEVPLSWPLQAVEGLHEGYVWLLSVPAILMNQFYLIPVVIAGGVVMLLFVRLPVWLVTGE